MSAHYGTHLDAPFHFFDDGRTVENLDLRRGCGVADVLDFNGKRPGDPITLEEVRARYGDKVKKGARLIFHTGWDKVHRRPHLLWRAALPVRRSDRTGWPSAA